jgi:hypothetical protein
MAWSSVGDLEDKPDSGAAKSLVSEHDTVERDNYYATATLLF